jgi:cohesin loading factor subunit SCC2
MSLIKLSDLKQKAGQYQYAISTLINIYHSYALQSLRDGRSIKTVSALLLQLVQTSAHDVRADVQRIVNARQESFALRRQDSLTENDSSPFLDEYDAQVRTC